MHRLCPRSFGRVCVHESVKALFTWRVQDPPWMGVIVQFKSQSKGHPNHYTIITPGIIDVLHI